MATKSSLPWKDGDTFLNSGEDRLGLLIVSIFGALLARYIIPEVLKYVRSR